MCRKYYPQSFKLPRIQKPDQVAMKAPKNIALRYFRFAANTGLTAKYLKLIGKRNDDKCWWCPEALPQNREHLFKECRKWRRQQEKLWKRLGQSRSHKKARPIDDIRRTSSYLEYLGLSRVDKRGESRRGGSGEGRREGGKGAETRRGGGGEERKPSVMRRPRGQGRPRERGDEESKKRVRQGEGENRG